MILAYAVISSWALAEIVKVVTTSFRAKEFDWQVVFFAGGMPSAHAALSAAIVTGLAFEQGASPLTIAAAVFGAMFIYDAMTLRRTVKEHSRILRRLYRKMDKGADVIRNEGGIGHTPLEVFVGVAIGIVVPALFYLG